MLPSSLEFLKSLLAIPGPSGFETGPAALWRAEANKFATTVRSDVGGNSYATLGSGDGGVMFAGHIDEIGLMVVHIDEDGYLWFDGIGGWDDQVLVGQRVIILGLAGEVKGVIGKKAIHMMEKDDRDKVSKIKDLWIDIGARDRQEAESLVRVGDAAVLDCAVTELPNGRLVSRSLDNRIGAFVVLEALRQLSVEPPTVRVTAVATAQEEIAHSGGGARTSAFSLAPAVAVVVDVTHATDTPGVQKTRHGEVKLGQGPILSRGSAVNPRVAEMLARVAREEDIPVAWQAAPRFTGTDADAIFTAKHGIATAVVSVPNRYMHSPNEMVAIEDLDRAARLLAAFARRVTSDSTFIP